MKWVLKTLGVLLGFSIIGIADVHAASSELAFPHYTQAEGKLDADGFPLSGVKLCPLPNGASCFEMPPAHIPGSQSSLYQFGLKPRSERLPLSSGGAWVFFSGMFSAGGSGMLERVAVLRYGAGGKIENLMPEMTETEMADRAMWNVPEVSPYPLFVRADFIWGKGEDHFGQHFFEVDAWAFDPATNQYGKRFSYRTAKRYDRGENSDHVLIAERGEILRRLKADRQLSSSAGDEEGSRSFQITGLQQKDGDIDGCIVELSRIQGSSDLPIFREDGVQSGATGFIRIDGKLIVLHLVGASGAARTFADTQKTTWVVETLKAGKAHQELDQQDESGTIKVTHGGLTQVIQVEGSAIC
ncbi:hypothetical protein [Burkholderia guangdongensis]|uniref:hypothetical protein n=1 Tax=Burkholderia guangdongensis TaxID=1792500 RepID=UPI001FE952A2|nr:hypothetical protein [Burkholderia guangdongensis]